MSEISKKLDILRHSTAHILATAVLEMFPEAKFGIGPTIEDGFYYDFDLPRTLIPEDLPILEEKMQKIIKNNYAILRQELLASEAIELFTKLKQPYKIELIKDLAAENNETDLKTFRVSSYALHDFVDLCRGPHLDSTGEIKPDAFKLLKIAGAYWRGDEKNKMLQRIYGTAWNNKKELDEYLYKIAEAEKRDHRVLGQKLELFLTDEQIGAGLPIWLPKGALIRKIIENYLYKELTEAGYEWLYTPHIGSKKLWEKSGHWNFYNENMYSPIEVGLSLEETQKGKQAVAKEEYLLKPMNCPFHLAVYNSKIRSYKELPVKYAEFGTVYRYERSGTLHGLTRVRSFTQDDAHLICAPEQMPTELVKLVKHGIKMLKDFGFKDYNIYLSTRPEKFVGSQNDWDRATSELEAVLNKLKLKYTKDVGGGVFYGPKIDIKIKDSLGREWQCTTIQFDFNLPERFDMNYIDKNGKAVRPFMIHRALLGSMERFFGVLIEHYTGAFPLWLAPIQAIILPIATRHNKYGAQIIKLLKEKGIRAKLNDNAETIGKKIREAETQKIPYMLIIGDKEMKNKNISVRDRARGDLGAMKIEKFIKKIIQ